MMTDSEITEYFENGSKEINMGKPDVWLISEGEPIFIMNIFKGKTRLVLAFIDGPTKLGLVIYFHVHQ